jgi:hypothetical protein
LRGLPRRSSMNGPIHSANAEVNFQQAGVYLHCVRVKEDVKHGPVTGVGEGN